MKILQVVDGFPPKLLGGNRIYTYYLSKELAKKHEVHIFYSVIGDAEKTFTAHFERENLLIHELMIPRETLREIRKYLFFEDIDTDKRIITAFKETLKEINPDIVHFENLVGMSGLISSAKEFDVPVILTLHDYSFICPNSLLLRYDYTICNGPSPRKCRECRIKGRASRASELLSQYHIPETLTKILIEYVLKIFNNSERFRRRSEKIRTLILKKIDKIIAPSKFLEKVLVKYKISEEKIVYVENGYNLEAFNNFKKKKKEKDKIIFGFVGRISQEKGIHVLIRAFNTIPEDKAELRIYGVIPKYKHAYAKKLLENAKNNIRYMGKYTDVKIPYSEIDVLVYPSIWYENSPLVLAEAKITKTPVIASRLGAIPEFVEDMKTGLLFEPNNPADLREKIMKIIENPELIDKFKENIKPPKSMKEHAKEIEQIYKELLRHH